MSKHGAKREHLLKVLGLKFDADETAIRAAYRDLAKKYHPDCASPKGSSSCEKFLEIQNAYESLTRQQLADIGNDGGITSFPGATRREQWNIPKSRPPLRTSAFDYFDLLSNFFGDFLFGKPELEIVLSRVEAATGVELKFDIPAGYECPRCGGRGIVSLHPCSLCGSAATITVTRRVRIEIPPGIENGTRLRILSDDRLQELGAVVRIV